MGANRQLKLANELCSIQNLLIEPATHTFPSDDGLTLAYHEVGSGRPVILLHGYISAALETWARSGATARLGTAGRRLIMPDMRGHGDSAKPHEPSAYPPDALTGDVRALIAHLGLTDYDLVGYSVGARIAARLMALGACPGPPPSCPAAACAGCRATRHRAPRSAVQGRDRRISRRSRLGVGAKTLAGRLVGSVTMRRMHHSELVCGWWLRL